MATVTRSIVPAVVKEVTPAQEVFHLELSPEEMALIYLLVGNCRGNLPFSYTLYQSLRDSLRFESSWNNCELSSEEYSIIVREQDITRVLDNRKK